MDFTTNYMGLELRSPLVASASPLTMGLDALKRLEDAGAGAAVLASLFEEQLEHEARELDHYLHYGAERFAESLTYFPQAGEYKLGPEEYLEYIAKAKAAVGIPIVASLNGVSEGGWIEYARSIAQAGADALELNIYFLPTGPHVTSQAVDDAYAWIVRSVTGSVDLPVAVKLSPYFSCLPSIARRLIDEGAEGLVLFNRFYQPDIDPVALEVRPEVFLSTSADNLLPLRWIAILFGRLDVSLAASSGIHTGRDAAKMLLAGADVAMMTSALLKRGPGHVKQVQAELAQVMEANRHESVAEMRGVMSQRNCPEPGAYERANYIKVLHSFGITTTLE
jgi:dihydroorotate dehydrogenase (fumarate)